MKSLLVKMLAAMVVMFVASPAMAQATRTWVSGVGDDANPCSRTAPCKTFAGAISKTAAGGEISVLDPGGFGGVTITKPITLKADGDLGSILVAGTNGVTVNINTATYPTAKVVIDGLEFEGLSQATTPGLAGVSVLSGRDVLIINSTFRNFNTGVNVSSSTQTRVTIDHTSILNNDVGILVTPSGAATNSVKVSNSLIAVSATSGISLANGLGKGYISNVVITGTNKALDLQGGAVMRSFGNNVLDGTTTDAPTPTPLQ